MLAKEIRDNIQYISTTLSDTEVTHAADTLLTHADLPGPIVAFLGAARRGKTTLSDRISGYKSYDEGVTNLTFGSDWVICVQRLFTMPYRYVVGTQKLVNNTLICDSASLGSLSNESVQEILKQADLALVSGKSECILVLNLL